MNDKKGMELREKSKKSLYKLLSYYIEKYGSNIGKQEFLCDLGIIENQLWHELDDSVLEYKRQKITQYGNDADIEELICIDKSAIEEVDDSVIEELEAV